MPLGVDNSLPGDETNTTSVEAGKAETTNVGAFYLEWLLLVCLFHPGTNVPTFFAPMKPLRWTTNAEEHAYMAERQRQNIFNSNNNKSENWFIEKLHGTGLKWARQSQWGYRIFDFWNHNLGVAIEVDGKGHRKKYDSYRDEYNFRRSGIVVLRVRAFSVRNKPGLLLSPQEDWYNYREAYNVI